MLKRQLKTPNPPKKKQKKNGETAFWHVENFDLVFMDHIKSHSSYGSVKSFELFWKDI